MTTPQFIPLTPIGQSDALRISISEIRCYHRRSEGGSTVVLHKLAVGYPLRDNELHVRERLGEIDEMLDKMVDKMREAI